MLTLYCRPNWGSQAVEALLAVCGADYRLHEVERNADGTLPDYFHRINPRAEIPTLKLADDSIMTESAAMMIYIADLYPEARMAPALDDPARPQYLRWMVYLTATVYQSDFRYYYPQRFALRPEDHEAVRQRGAEAMARDFAIFAAGVGQGPFILGTRMSAVDLYAAMMMTWSPDMKGLFAAHPNLEALYQAVTAVPAVKAVWQRNGV